ncbi:hypothetical protein QZH41_006294 [Actinostola sp. cb2023]|nr:hypothetical protein QZH41_006294 [Actinostola sp. cb2023]
MEAVSSSGRSQISILQDYTTIAFELLRRFHESRELCDVVLCVDDTRIPAHRVVLAASSPYFRAMFSGKMVESSQKEIFLCDLDAKVMEQLVSFFYTGKIVIDEDNVQSLLYASCVLAIVSVKQYCCDFLEQEMCVANCLGIRAIADTLSCTELYTAADSFVSANFSQLLHCEEFLLQPYESLVALVERDYLGISGETELLDGVIKWLHWDSIERTSFAHSLLKRLHLLQIGACHLQSLLTDSVVAADPNCIDLILEQIEALGSKSVASAYEFPMFMNRKYGKAKEVLLAIGGESAGVVLDNVECYDLESLKWSWTFSDNDMEPASLPTVCQCHTYATASSTGRHVYVVGGSSSWKALDVVQRYEWPENNWEQISSLNHGRLGAGSAIVDGQLLAVGGCGRKGYLSSVEAYDPLVDKWTVIAPMQLRRSYLGVAELNGYVYAVGGYGGVSGENDCWLSSVECYMPSSDMWVPTASMLHSRAYFGLAAERGAGPGAAFSFHGAGHGGRGGGFYQDRNTSRYYSWEYYDTEYLLGGSTSTVMFESKPGSGGGAIEIIVNDGVLLIGQSTLQRQPLSASRRNSLKIVSKNGNIEMMADMDLSGKIVGGFSITNLAGVNAGAGPGKGFPNTNAGGGHGGRGGLFREANGTVYGNQYGVTPYTFIGGSTDAVIRANGYASPLFPGGPSVGGSSGGSIFLQAKGFKTLNNVSITTENSQKVVQDLLNLTTMADLNGGDTQAAVSIMTKLATGNVLVPKNTIEAKQVGQAIVKTASVLLGTMVIIVMVMMMMIVVVVAMVMIMMMMIVVVVAMVMIVMVMMIVVVVAMVMIVMVMMIVVVVAMVMIVMMMMMITVVVVMVMIVMVMMIVVVVAMVMIVMMMMIVVVVAMVMIVMVMMMIVVVVAMVMIVMVMMMMIVVVVVTMVIVMVMMMIIVVVVAMVMTVMVIVVVVVMVMIVMVMVMMMMIVVVVVMPYYPNHVLEVIEKIAVDLGSGLKSEEYIAVESNHLVMGIERRDLDDFTGGTYPRYDKLTEKWQFEDFITIPEESVVQLKKNGANHTTIVFVLYNGIEDALKSNLENDRMINSRVLALKFDQQFTEPFKKPVVMSLTKRQTSRAHEKALEMITYIGCGISLFGLALTLATFLSLETLASERTSIHKNLVVAIGLAQIIFLAGIDAVYNPIACKIVALALHYLYMAAFTWMCCEGIHLYTKVIEVFSSETSKMKYYYMLGWGVPLIIVIISAASRMSGYGSGTAAGLKGMMVLLPLLGLTWVFGLMAVNEKTIAFQYVFAIFNSLQVRIAYKRLHEKRTLAKMPEHSLSSGNHHKGLY